MRSGLIIVGLSALLWSCTSTGTASIAGGTDISTGPSTGTTNTGISTGSTVTITTGGVFAVVSDNPANPLSLLLEVTPEVDAMLRVEIDDGIWVRQTPEFSAAAAIATEFPLLGLRPGMPHTLRLLGTAQGPIDSVIGTFDTPPQPPWWPSANIDDRSGGTLDPAEVICSHAQTAQGPFHFCIDSEGTPRWALFHDEFLLSLNPLLGGGWIGNSDESPRVVIFDDASRELRSFGPGDFAGQTTYVHNSFDVHDAIGLWHGKWAGLAAVLTIVEENSPTGFRVGQGIIVFDPQTGDVHWDWSAAGVLGDGESVDESSLPYSRSGLIPEGEDWLHSNAVVHTPDDKFWISMRHQEWIVQVDPTTGNIDYRIGWGGDFTLVDDLDAATPNPVDTIDWHYHQHAPEIVSVTGDRIRFLTFDNGNARVSGGSIVFPGYSRAAEFEIDTSTMLAQNTFAYGSPSGGEDDFYSEGVGDADLVSPGDRVALIKGWGVPFISQVSYPEGDLVWKATFPGQNEMYRAAVRPTVYDVEWGN